MARDTFWKWYDRIARLAVCVFLLLILIGVGYRLLTGRNPFE
jgi:hypothetical protein